MATTKIPIVYGSKPSKHILRGSHHYRQNTLSPILSLGSLDKDQPFQRYYYDSEALHNSLEYDDEYSIGNNGTNRHNAGHDLQSFPVTICEGASNASRLSSKLNRKGKFVDCFQSQKYSAVSHNFADYLCQRSQGLIRNLHGSVTNDYGVQKMISNHLFKESTLKINSVNKIFCSKWLTNDQIVMGTKCNQLLLYNINSKKVDHIPSLRGNTNDHPLSDQCGIHALELNPSKTLLATGAQSSNEIAIYSLPTLDPVCMGENAHSDWVFDLCWLDDHFLVSASRDKSLAVWRVEGDEPACSFPRYEFMEPLATKRCMGAGKVRALLFNPNYMEIVALSLNAKIHVWDATLFKQVMSQKLEFVHENVCMAKTENCSVYAVGSKSHVTLIDPRTLQSIGKIDSRKNGPNIRSLSFMGSLLTIGTGMGDILFYDIKAGRYLDASDGTVELNCSKCKVSVEDSPYSPTLPENSAADPAIYTHCYDWSGTRLFAAGGPLSAAFKGSYASLWC